MTSAWLTAQDQVSRVVRFFEGMAQTCNALLVIVGIRRTFEERGQAPDEALGALRLLDSAYGLLTGYQPEVCDPLLRGLAERRRTMGFTAAVDVKLTAPVFPGQRLVYEVAVARRVGELTRFEVDASAEGQRVAHGAITSRCEGFSLPPPPPGP
jgi:3-hydroxymyristoyl/3-hydroxydecanoyl-(acyl carrier protein) dehydratase